MCVVLKHCVIKHCVCVFKHFEVKHCVCVLKQCVCVCTCMLVRVFVHVRLVIFERHVASINIDYFFTWFVLRFTSVLIRCVAIPG